MKISAAQAGTAQLNALLALYGTDNLFKNPYQGYYPVHFQPWLMTRTSKEQFYQVEDTRQFDEQPELLKKILGDRQAWNGETLILMAGFSHNHLQLQVAKGRYFDTLISSYRLSQGLLHDDALSHQTRHQFNHQPTFSSDSFNWSAPNLSAALSVSTTLVIFDGKQYQLAYAKRSDQVAEDAGKFHLLPSMLLQPNQDVHQRPIYSVVLDMVKQELAEELFSQQEEKANSCEAIDTLEQMLSDQGAEFYITGIATDLRTLRPEITSLLVIHDPHWLQSYQHAFQLCEFEYNPGASTQLLYPCEAEALLAPNGPFAPHACVDTAGVCLTSAMHFLLKASNLVAGSAQPFYIKDESYV